MLTRSLVSCKILLCTTRGTAKYVLQQPTLDEFLFNRLPGLLRRKMHCRFRKNNFRSLLASRNKNTLWKEIKSTKSCLLLSHFPTRKSASSIQRRDESESAIDHMFFLSQFFKVLYHNQMPLMILLIKVWPWWQKDKIKRLRQYLLWWRLPTSWENLLNLSIPI